MYSKKPYLCFLIDDDIDDQEIFSLAINKLDIPIQCEIANSGLEAIHRFTEDVSFQPDIVFLDINMPKMDGLQCMVELKKITHIKDCLMIIYSTSLQKNTVEIFKNNGVHDFLEKPTSFNLLTESLGTIFNGLALSR